MKKIITFILLMICAVMIFTGCEQNTVDTPVDSTTDESQNPPDTTLPADTGEDTSVGILRDGEPAFLIVRPEKDDAKSATVTQAAELRLRLNELTEKTFGITTDYDERKEGALEILVGNTSREESRAVYDELGYNQYAIRYVNGHIVIAGRSDSSIQQAVSVFYETVRKSKGNGFKIDVESLTRTLTDKKMPAIELPVAKSAKFVSYNNVQGTNAARYSFTIESDFNDAEYTEKLKSSGYTEVAYHTNADYSSGVYSKDGWQVTFSVFPKAKELNILVDKAKVTGALTPGTFEVKVTPKVISPGSEYAGAIKGMCYILQASDGSYVIIDGGDDDAVFTERIYQLLLKYKPESDEKPHIRAWFLTHQHSDHMNGIINFGKSYNSKVVCDAIYTNMPLEKYQTAYTNYASRYSRMTTAASNLRADFVIYRTAQTYYFADISVTMLETVDDLAPTVFANVDNTSPALIANVAGYGCFFSGDADHPVFGKVTSRYTAETLDSVFVQASSHGENQAAPESFYKMATASYYLWPATIAFYNMKTPEAVILNDKNAEVFISGYGTDVFELGKDGNVTMTETAEKRK